MTASDPTTPEQIKQALGEELKLQNPDALIGDHHVRLSGGVTPQSAGCTLDLDALASAILALGEGERLSPEDAWLDLLEKNDRTSPEEYPDMALITFDELRDYMEATDLRSRLSAAEARIKALREGLERLSSMEAFTGSRMVKLPQDEELIARIDFAAQLLKEGG